MEEARSDIVVSENDVTRWEFAKIPINEIIDSMEFEKNPGFALLNKLKELGAPINGHILLVPDFLHYEWNSRGITSFDGERFIEYTWRLKSIFAEAVEWNKKQASVE